MPLTLRVGSEYYHAPSPTEDINSVARCSRADDCHAKGTMERVLASDATGACASDRGRIEWSGNSEINFGTTDAIKPSTLDNLFASML
jgi:hypothetical protein